jgi:hypothetical protein
MIVQSLPRQGGKTTALARYMTEPGNEDVVCLAPTRAQANVVYHAAREIDPEVDRHRFCVASDRHHFRRAVIDEADVVIEQLLGCRVDMIALTERSTE